MDQKTLVKNLMTGKDGRLLIEFDGNLVVLLQVDSYKLTSNYTNIDYQPVGSDIGYKIPSKKTYALTYTEAVVSDEYVMTPLMEAAVNGKNINFVFQTMATRPDGTEQRVTCRECIPDGDFDLMSLTPGEIIKRTNTFALNDVPEWISALDNL